MKKLTLISISIFLLTNILFAQDIINETGKDGKFIVRDAEQQEALIIEDGNVGITGELKIETMTEGADVDGMVVWDRNDKTLKVVPRVFSLVSPLSKPLQTEAVQTVVRGNAAGEYVSMSILDIQALDVNDEIRIRNSSSTDGILGTAHLSFRGSSGLEYGWMGDGGGSTNSLALFATKGDAKLMAWAPGKGVELWDGTGQVVTVVGGNVGIGTTNPLSKLSVGGSGLTHATIYGETDTGRGVYGRAYNTGAATNFGGYFETAGMTGRGVYGRATNTGAVTNYGGFFQTAGIYGQGVYGLSTGAYGLGVYGYATHADGTTYGIRGKVNSENGWAGYFDGRGYFRDNVGIGTTDPLYPLHVNAAGPATLMLQADSNPKMYFKQNASLHTFLQAFDNDFVIRNIIPTGELKFGTANIDRVIIDSAGNVGIGTTTPYEALHVSGKIRSDTGFNTNNSDGVTGTYNFYNDGSTSGQVTSITVNGGIITAISSIP